MLRLSHFLNNRLTDGGKVLSLTRRPAFTPQEDSLEKKWEYNETVHQLFVDFKKAYDSVRREVLYNILIELG
jgi:hypothetical protein